MLADCVFDAGASRISGQQRAHDRKNADAETGNRGHARMHCGRRDVAGIGAEHVVSANRVRAAERHLFRAVEIAGRLLCIERQMHARARGKPLVEVELLGRPDVAAARDVDRHLDQFRERHLALGGIPQPRRPPLVARAPGRRPRRCGRLAGGLRRSRRRHRRLAGVQSAACRRGAVSCNDGTAWLRRIEPMNANGPCASPAGASNELAWAARSR